MYCRREIDSTYSITGGEIQNTMTVTSSATNQQYECRVRHPRLESDLISFYNTQGQCCFSLLGLLVEIKVSLLIAPLCQIQF